MYDITRYYNWRKYYFDFFAYYGKNVNTTLIISSNYELIPYSFRLSFSIFVLGKLFPLIRTKFANSFMQISNNFINIHELWTKYNNYNSIVLDGKNLYWHNTQNIDREYRIKMLNKVNNVLITENKICLNEDILYYITRYF